MKNTLVTILAAGTLLCACSGSPAAFWTEREGHFYRGSDTAPQYFIGTNMWYGPLLASDTGAADPQRLFRELDSLKAIGITNLRVLVGADGTSGPEGKVKPALQTSPGVWDESVFVGLDRFLAELGKRDMTAVLFLNNAWEWSGGFGQYLEWAGAGKARSTMDALWSDYCAFTSQFVVNSEAKEMFRTHIRNTVSRVNTVTGKAYRDDPAIFAWQICNEPRFFVSDPALKEAFIDWIWDSARLIKSLDPNHLVSTGSEGSWGCEGDWDVYRRMHECPDVDYLTCHIWPLNWSWAHKESLGDDLEGAVDKTCEYIREHIAVAEELGKPLVVEEFGFPRDGFQFAKGTPTTLRDQYYTAVFNILLEQFEKKGVFAGANFWTWGGMAKQTPGHTFWQEGDDYSGDPAQEQQGLNSVYQSDASTISLLRSTCHELEQNRLNRK